MYKIAVMGDRDSVLAFSSVGIDVVAIDETKQPAKELKKLADNDYAIIFITEALATQIKTEIEKYKTSVIPAIILIPGVRDNTGEAMDNLKKLVEQAVGSDILS